MNTRTWMGVCVAFVSSTGPAPFNAYAQPKAATARWDNFEVASVKPSRPGDSTKAQPSWGDISGKVILRNIPLKAVLLRAFNLQSEQINGPGWLDDESFEILANVPAGAPKERIPIMFQSLLIARFKLKFHRETRVEPVYALVVGKGGPKLTETTPTDTSGPPPAPKYTRSGTGEDVSISRTTTGPFGRGTWTLANGNARFDYDSITMEDLAKLLSQPPVILGLRVVDMTGLKGSYKVTFGYPAIAMRGAAPGLDQASDPQVSLLEYLQKMGLSLVRRETSTELLVVDHIERKPTPN